jgi:hypothetical protein
MLKLTFNCFNQILLPSYFTFLDKINLFVMVGFLLILLMYCFCYYPLVYSFNHKLSSQTLLTKTKFSLPSFYFESIYIVFRNFVRSAIHSLLISNYELQISLLSILDIFFLILSIKMWKCFINKVVLMLCVTYSFAFLCFDMFFVIKIFSRAYNL